MFRRVTLIASSLLLSATVASAAMLGSGLATRVAGVSAASAYCATADDIAILNYVNQHRAENGLPPLVLSADLGTAADYHSEDMATNNYFSHVLSDGTTWSENIQSYGYDQNTWRGENIAAGNSDPYQTYLQWLNSPGHNANMLNPNFQAIGIGMAENPSSDWDYYWTQTFGGYVDTPAVACDGSDPNAQWDGGSTSPTPTVAPRSAQSTVPVQPTSAPRPPRTSTQLMPTATPIRTTSGGAPQATQVPRAPRATTVPTEVPRPPRPTSTPRTVSAAGAGSTDTGQWDAGQPSVPEPTATPVVTSRGNPPSVVNTDPTRPPRS